MKIGEAPSGHKRRWNDEKHLSSVALHFHVFWKNEKHSSRSKTLAGIDRYLERAIPQPFSWLRDSPYFVVFSLAAESYWWRLGGGFTSVIRSKIRLKHAIINVYTSLGCKTRLKPLFLSSLL
jgi:hypothetical protein